VRDPVPTEEEVKGWLAHPTTRAFREMLRLGREELKERWARRMLRGETEHDTVILETVALAQIELTDKLLNLDYEQFIDGLTEEDEHEEQQKQPD